MERELTVLQGAMILLVITSGFLIQVLNMTPKNRQSKYVQDKLQEMASNIPQKKPQVDRPLKVTWALVTVGTECKESISEWNCKPRTIRLGLEEGGAVLWK